MLGVIFGTGNVRPRSGRGTLVPILRSLTLNTGNCSAGFMSGSAWGSGLSMFQLEHCRSMSGNAFGYEPNSSLKLTAGASGVRPMNCLVIGARHAEQRNFTVSDPFGVVSKVSAFKLLAGCVQVGIRLCSCFQNVPQRSILASADVLALPLHGLVHYGFVCVAWRSQISRRVLLAP